MSEKVKPFHRSRKAILYIRQSSQYQVVHCQESQRLQYGMKARLSQMGWNDIEVIDEDLGLSASGTKNRQGFDRMVTQVCMGTIGAVATRELSRFARNSREWQKLIEVCRVVDTILIDHDTVYDARHSNDRLLLGLKGSLNEYELDLLRSRSLEARREKARRGELLVSVPAGYVKHNGSMEKTADLRVQKAIERVFQKFPELASVRQTLCWFLDNNIKMPCLQNDGQVEWKHPRYSTIINVLKNPVYAGIYAYGKTQMQQVFKDGRLCTQIKTVPRKDWRVYIPDHHEGYISEEKFERIQAMIAENVQNSTTKGKGAVKRGPALLAGLLRCRRCGRKLTVGYTGREKNVLRYFCRRGHLDTGEAKCINFGGDDVDKAVVREVLRVIQPGAIDAAYQAWQRYSRQQDEVTEALGLELQDAQYLAQRAWKQYNATDPENRLVANELEKRWNTALERMERLEQRIQDEKAGRDSRVIPSKKDFMALAERLPIVWEHPQTDVRLKKRIIRTVVEEIVVDTNSEKGFIDITIHWKGGVHTQLQVRRRKRGKNSLHTPEDVVRVILQLVKVCSDDMIANCLSRNGLRTGYGNRWTRQRVESFRLKRKIPKCTPERKAQQGWMNLTEAAEYLGVSGMPLRKAVERGKLHAEHPLPDGPWIFQHKDLDTPEVRDLVKAIKNRRRRPAEQNVDNLILFKSSTCLEVVV